MLVCKCGFFNVWVCERVVFVVCVCMCSFVMSEYVCLWVL